MTLATSCLHSADDIIKLPHTSTQLTIWHASCSFMRYEGSAGLASSHLYSADERRDLRVLEVLNAVVISYLAKDFLMEEA